MEKDCLHKFKFSEEMSCAQDILYQGKYFTVQYNFLKLYNTVTIYNHFLILILFQITMVRHIP